MGGRGERLLGAGGGGFGRGVVGVGPRLGVSGRPGTRAGGFSTKVSWGINLVGRGWGLSGKF